jgi:hypothetical protein
VKIKSPICGAYLDTKDDIACLPLTGIDVRPACGEVTLDFDNDWGDMREFGPGVWLHLTPDEARQLATDLFREAHMAMKHDEQSCQVCIQNRKWRAAEASRAARTAAGVRGSGGD